MALLNLLLPKSQEKNYKLLIILLYMVNNKYYVFNLIKNVPIVNLLTQIID